MADNELKQKIILEAEADTVQIKKESKKAWEEAWQSFSSWYENWMKKTKESILNEVKDLWKQIESEINKLDSFDLKLNTEDATKELQELENMAIWWHNTTQDLQDDLAKVWVKFSDLWEEWKVFEDVWENIKDFRAAVKSIGEEVKKNIEPVEKLWDKVEDVWKKADKAAWDDNKWMLKFMKWLKNTAIWTAVIAFAEKLTKKLIELWTAYWKIADEFDRFTWSSTITNDLLNQLNQFSNSNWLDVNKVRETASELLRMWTAVEDIVPLMSQLWDISAWTWASMEDLTDIMKDINKEWNLTTDTFNDLIEAWVPIWDQLAEDLWLTVDQVKKLASEWKITDEQVSAAFQHMTEEWGVFYWAMDQASTTLEGRLNTLKWKFQEFWEKIANAVMPAFEWLMEDAQNTADALMETWQTWESWMLLIQKWIYSVVTFIRWLVKVIQSAWAVIGSYISWKVTKAKAIFTAFWDWIANLIEWIGSKETWKTLWDNIAYWIWQWVNSAIDALNTLTDWISQIPWINIWKVDHVNWWSNWWIFDFSWIKNAFEGANMAMSDTINDLSDDWSNFFKDTKEWWNNLWKEVEKSGKKTNATLGDLIKDLNKKSSKWAKDTEKEVLKTQKEELEKLRDLKIKEVEDSYMSESDKRKKLLEIYDWYKNELIELEWKTNDELLKENEKYLEQYQKEYEKASEEDQKAVEKSIEKIKKLDEQIWKVADKRSEYKDKALKSLREVNNSIEELDKDFAKDMSERYWELLDKRREMLSKDSYIQEYAKRYSKEDLYGMQESWQSKIWDIAIKDILEFKSVMEELTFIEDKYQWELWKEIELTEKLTESEKKYQEYLEKRGQLVEQQKIYQAYADQKDLWEEAIKIEEDKVMYYDKEKDAFVEITDFKNQELARELLNQQIKLQTENKQLEDAKKTELWIIEDTSKKILKRWQDDTSAYKIELKKREDAVRDYVESVKEMLASVPDSYRAYWWTLNTWVTMVWENWPEAIVARQSAYVQPRNAVQNNSTVYNNQNSLSINWIEIWNFNTVEDLLNWLKPYLTRRN